MVTGAIDQVTRACQSAGMPLGYFGVTADAIRPYMEKGYNLIVAGVDSLFVASGAKHMKAQLTSMD